jgi:hypothetical protein
MRSALAADASLRSQPIQLSKQSTCTARTTLDRTLRHECNRTKPWVNITQGVPCRKPRHRLGGRNIVASKTHLAGDQVIALAVALAWLVVVSVLDGSIGRCHEDGS